MSENMQQHPLSAAFPAMTDTAFAELRADIASNGLHNPLVVFEGKVLDGWHRYRACQEVGVSVRSRPFEGDEAAARKFVVSANLMRRHLDASQRQLIAAKLAPAAQGQRTDLQLRAKLPEVTTKEAAELLNVSERGVKDARTVLASGDTATIEKVERGEVSVSRAAKEIRASTPRQVSPPRPVSPPRAPAPALVLTSPQPAPVRRVIEITPQTIEQWNSLPADDQAQYLTHRNPQASLNQQKTGEDDNLIDWAKWTWNPITGCLHNCPYCYARDISERFSGTSAFPNGFAPTLRAERLSAPLNTRPRQSDDPREGRIFVGSMTDLWGRWVPKEWIEAVLGIMRQAPQWEFLTLTKFPKRMSEFDIPDNVWAGTSVDCQARVASAEAAFAKIGGKYHWLSCEPLIEPLHFSHLDRFDMIAIGGASASNETPKWIPPYSWIQDLREKAHKANCRVYVKSNAYLKEHPGGPMYEDSDRAPDVFNYLARAATQDQKAA